MTAELPQDRQASPKIGRPTLYRDEYPEMLVAYFQERYDAIIANPAIAQEQGGRGSGQRNVQAMFAEFPTLAGFAHSIETHEQRLSEWANRHEAFAEARARVVGVTKHLLIGGMLDGRYNAQAAQFVAKNLVGMRDKNEVELSGPAGGPLATSLTLEFVATAALRNVANPLTIEATAEPVAIEASTVHLTSDK